MTNQDGFVPKISIQDNPTTTTTTAATATIKMTV